jgi:hypothetical protein
MKKFYYLLFTALFLTSALLTSSALKAKNGKDLLPSELIGKTVILEEIMLSTHANTLSKEDMKNFIDNYMPALVADFEQRFAEKYNATLDTSAYKEEVKKNKVRVRLNKMAGVVMGRWKNKAEADLKASLSITIKNIEQKITIAGIIKKEDPKDAKKPFTDVMSYFYYIKR